MQVSVTFILPVCVSRVGNSSVESSSCDIARSTITNQLIPQSRVLETLNLICRCWFLMQSFEYMTVAPSLQWVNNCLVCKPGLNVVREKGTIIMTVDWLKKYVHTDNVPCCDTCLNGRNEVFKKLFIITALLYS
jgi:hypothetical protein